MKITRTAALGIATLGLALVIAGPLLPGGERLVRNDPPRTGHVTDLARASDGSILAGTQDGELWHLSNGVWRRVPVDLGGQPVTALAADLTGDPARGPIGTAGGLVNPPPGVPPLNERITDEQPTRNGLVVATGEGLLIQRGDRWERVLEDVFMYRLEPQTHDGGEYLHAGSVGQGVFTAVVDDLVHWRPNRNGLPEGRNVFSFVQSTGGYLIAGSDQGLYWQPAPFTPWQPLRVGLERSRMLSLLLQPAERDAAQRLWIGTDTGLHRVALTEDEQGLAATAYAELIEAPPEHVRYGISWIVPFGDGILFSAGAVYQYGPTGLAAWYLISLAGVVLILLGGWLMPARNPAGEQPTVPR
ncbi:MAG: ABC transporter substrate-binding protein [Chromatiaceae bacterium]|nr:MAG: ABC transporter substrate-binding protein [Chromatiaceae bacterium]